MQAHVPEETTLQQHLKYSIEFDILCPVSGCNFIKFNGTDNKHSLQVQKFYCNHHKRSFYAHTSWVMKNLAEIIVIRIILKLFTGRVSENYLAKQYHMSASSLSSMINSCQDHVQSIIQRIKDDVEKLKKLEKREKLPGMLENVIWLDETFFKIAKKSWALILAINAHGEILGWKLSRTRNAEDILEVLKQVDQNFAGWQYMVGDGNPAYPKALLKRHRDVYLIQQLHSHPWQDVKMHKFEVLPDRSVTQSTILVNYQSLNSELLQVGYALERTHLPPSNKPVGRPKGSKNRRNHKKSKKKIKHKKRGPKTPRSSGKAFLMSNAGRSSDQFLEVQWVKKSFKIKHNSNKNASVPSLATVQELLWVAFSIFSASAIVSNRIESKNSEIKNVMPNRGLRKEKNLRNRVEPLVMLHSNKRNKKSWVNLPISASLGFKNLSLFCRPEISQIQLKSNLRG